MCIRDRRRILLPDQLSFADLHVILQIVFGWQEEHLHDFSFQRSRVRISDTEYALSLIHIFPVPGVNPRRMCS